MSKKGKEPKGLRRYRLEHKRKKMGKAKKGKKSRKKVGKSKRKKHGRKRTGELVNVQHKVTKVGKKRKKARSKKKVSGKKRGRKRSRGISGIGAHPVTHGQFMGAHKTICG